MTKAPTKTTAPEAGVPKKAPLKKSPGTKVAATPGTGEPKQPKVKGALIAAPKPGAKPNALQQPLQPSAELAAIVGSGTMPRGEIVSKVWEYIKKNKLQAPDDGRMIVPDEALKKVLTKPKVSMFEMNKLLSQHLK